MVDLAKQAFTTNNFDLSAEIYERNIKENGPTLDMYLGLADSYARGGHLQKAFEAYIQAYRLGSVKPCNLNQLVAALVEIMRGKEQVNANSSEQTTEDIFTCGLCMNLWQDPVTINCGHTFCRGCLTKEESKNCKKCKVPRKNKKISNLKTNVLLSQTLERWFSDEVQAIRLKKQGNEYFQKRKFKEAVEVYSKAFSHAPTDHTIPSNRSHAFASIDKFSDALDDAEIAVKLRPDWPKGYYRKGTALTGLSRHEEAAFAYLQCLTLDPQVTSARTALAKSIHLMLSPLPPADLKRAELQAYLSPYPMARAIGGLPPLLPPTPQHCPSPAFLSKATLLSLRSTLEGAISQTGAPEDESHEENAVSGNRTETTSSEESNSNPANDKKSRIYLDANQWRTCRKTLTSGEPGGCRSAPVTPPSSPQLLGKRSRASSDSKLKMPVEPTKSTGSENDMVVVKDEPRSPSKSAPPKQAKAEVSTAKVEGQREVSLDLRDKEDFECTLCYRMLFSPVTTPCGHVFCRQCLDRCLDHSTVCPLCKSTLVEYLAERRQATTESIEEIIQTYFPEDYAERLQIHEQEFADLARMGADDTQEVPVFVCTLAYPKMACPLHIFEPRYRLMVRQCMESGTRQFGMCVQLDEHDETFSDYGCMLEIRDVQYFPDGRSVVDTVGGRRFKVLSRSMRDGYQTAKVEFLKDRLVEDEQELQALRELHNEVHKEAETWIESLPVMHRMRIQQHMGTIPDVEQTPLTLIDGPAWHWWLLAVLPLDPRAQLSIIAMMTLKDRLVAVRRVLQYVQRRGRSQ